VHVSAWPYVIIAVLLAGMLLLSLRNRRRQAAEEIVRVSRIGVGAEVMTTSGLYGTVVRTNDDGTVLLAVAPGVEVKWAAAALRDAASLTETYRRGLQRDGREHSREAGRDGVELRKTGDEDGGGS
jgi:preprotein translocase subunit YajC